MHRKFWMRKICAKKTKIKKKRVDGKQPFLSCCAVCVRNFSRFWTLMREVITWPMKAEKKHMATDKTNQCCHLTEVCVNNFYRFLFLFTPNIYISSTWTSTYLMLHTLTIEIWLHNDTFVNIHFFPSFFVLKCMSSHIIT